MLEQGWGLQVSRGGLCQAIERVARKAEPTYEVLRERIRAEPSVTPDETGWKVGGQLWWMWACSSPRMTVYAIQPGRGFPQAAAILGEGFDGFLVRNGWGVYRQFTQALHQTCLAHLLRRCREMVQVAGTKGAQFPRAVQTLLQSSLDLRDRRDRGQISPHRLAVARGQLEARLDCVLRKRTRSPANRRLANHLWRERDAVFPFLYCPGLQATNWRAEQVPARRDHAQSVGRKPHGGRSPDPKHLAQHSRNLPPAPAAGAAAAGAPTLFPPTAGVGFDDSTPTGTLAARGESVPRNVSWEECACADAGGT